MKQVFIQIILMACLLGYANTAIALSAKDRQNFMAAEKALKKNQYKTFLSLKNKLKNYSLYPYLEYADLKRNMGKHSKSRVQKFLTTYPKGPLAYRVQNTWLRSLVRQGKWADYQHFYEQGFQHQKQTDLSCYQAYAMYRNGEKKAAFAKAQTLWMVSHSQHVACDNIFKAWKASGGISQAMLWQRFKLSMEKGKKGLRFAKTLSKKMHKENRAWANLWFKVTKKPSIAFINAALKGSASQGADILLYALKKEAKKSVSKAVQRWRALPALHRFNEQERQQGEKILATYMAYQKHSNSITQMNKVNDSSIIDDRFEVLRLRTALRHGSWKHVQKWIEALSNEKQQENVWKYWYARALEQQGQPEQAQAIYSTLSKKRDYYGFLASDRIGSDYSFETDLVPSSPEKQQSIRALDTVERVFELTKLNRLTEANREWWYLINHQLKRSDAEQAAKFAHTMGWYHRAIMSMTWIKSWNDLSIRFPLEHKNTVLLEAKAKSLDPAWVYGIIRQESAFWKEARSSSGALGLMQLMPGTAKHIAKKLKIINPSKQQLFTPEVNIHMGTKYLRMMLDRLENHPVLATAAYNAGPHRALKWLPKKTNIDADIWVELIPFTETRRYVRRVMAYTIIYQHRLQQKTKRLSKRMKPISSMVQREPQTLLALKSHF
ncbi:MAG: transglycosylase SLT domain-containing protein [Mariprofundaceae bacterium]|nr:transglycosylase SLT domain-containing protein [Mariprofundaceae bacterium]